MFSASSSRSRAARSRCSPTPTASRRSSPRPVRRARGHDAKPFPICTAGSAGPGPVPELAVRVVSPTPTASRRSSPRPCGCRRPRPTRTRCRSGPASSAGRRPVPELAGGVVPRRPQRPVGLRPDGVVVAGGDNDESSPDLDGRGLLGRESRSRAAPNRYSPTPTASRRSSPRRRARIRQRRMRIRCRSGQATTRDRRPVPELPVDVLPSAHSVPSGRMRSVKLEPAAGSPRPPGSPPRRS